MNIRKASYISALIGLFGLVFLILLWNVWIMPPVNTPRSLILLMQLPLLLLPMRGMLHGRPYTFAWATFVALLYFIIGVDNAAMEDRAVYGGLEILFSLLMFIGSMVYTRLESRRLKALEGKPTQD
jgi:uncharacterized membrane protein